jgi:hypothetical protein
MRALIVIAVVALAGCAGGTPNADAARRICADNGHSLGSDGFHRCFETTYAAIMGASQPAAAPVSMVCNRIGQTTICN